MLIKPIRKLTDRPPYNIYSYLSKPNMNQKIFCRVENIGTNSTSLGLLK